MFYIVFPNTIFAHHSFIHDRIKQFNVYFLNMICLLKVRRVWLYKEYFKKLYKSGLIFFNIANFEEKIRKYVFRYKK